jgi:hypothetical protein
MGGRKWRIAQYSTTELGHLDSFRIAVICLLSIGNWLSKYRHKILEVI